MSQGGVSLGHLVFRRALRSRPLAFLLAYPFHISSLNFHNLLIPSATGQVRADVTLVGNGHGQVLLPYAIDAVGFRVAVRHAIEVGFCPQGTDQHRLSLFRLRRPSQVRLHRLGVDECLSVVFVNSPAFHQLIVVVSQQIGRIGCGTFLHQPDGLRHVVVGRLLVARFVDLQA